jgi:hypothetical protein
MQPLKIPLFPKTSGRADVDQLLGISIEQLTKQVPVPKNAIIVKRAPQLVLKVWLHHRNSTEQIGYSLG